MSMAFSDSSAPEPTPPLAVHLDPVDEPLTVPNESCINAKNHTPEPRGYLPWFDWAARMAKTHHQKRCPHCGLYVIWEGGKSA